MTLFHGAEKMLKHVGGRSGQNKTKVNLTNALLLSHCLNTLLIENVKGIPKNIDNINHYQSEYLNF